MYAFLLVLLSIRAHSWRSDIWWQTSGKFILPHINIKYYPILNYNNLKITNISMVDFATYFKSPVRACSLSRHFARYFNTLFPTRKWRLVLFFFPFSECKSFTAYKKKENKYENEFLVRLRSNKIDSSSNSINTYIHKAS